MRLLLAVLALAGALLHVVPANAQILDERYPAAAMSAGATAPHSRSGGVIGVRPKGCPHAYCGCASSLYLFGKIVPALNLAANWLRFPHAAPAPKMAAARPGHVFVLERHIAGNTWLVFDPNSGGHRTRLHARSIAGFTIVNPRSS